MALRAGATSEDHTPRGHASVPQRALISSRHPQLGSVQDIVSASHEEQPRQSESRVA